MIFYLLILYYPLLNHHHYLNGKRPRYVEAYPNAAVGPLGVGAGQKLGFGQSERIGHEHLEDVAAGFDVPADAEGVVIFGARVFGGPPSVLDRDGAAFADFKPGGTGQHHRVVEVGDARHLIDVDEGRAICREKRSLNLRPMMSWCA